MAGKTRGPEPKLTDELAQAFCDHLRQGHYKATAAALVGVHPTTISVWLGKEREPYKSFQALVREAEAEAEATQLAKITASHDPADAKWYLARKHPDRWAETRRVDVSGRLDMGIKLNAGALADPTARAHVMGLTDWLFATGNDQSDSDGPSSEQS